MRWGLCSLAMSIPIGFSIAGADDCNPTGYLAAAPTEVEIHRIIYVVSKGTMLKSSKSRNAPLKTVTVLKMELSQLKDYTGKYFCWCDSVVARSWIWEEPACFHVFVANLTKNRS